MTRTRARLQRSDWLQGALDLMRETGAAGLRIEKLAAHMGVTTGSLYWHFEDRADLLRQVAAYWADRSTEQIAQAIVGMGGTPQQRLLALMRMVLHERASRHDLTMRAWAAWDPLAAKVVLQVDRRRAQVVGGLFEEMGFRGVELESRTRLVLTNESCEELVRPRLSRARREQLLAARHRMLVAGAPEGP